MAGPTLTARLYSLLFRRTSTFALTIAVGALFFERAFDQGADAIYEHINEGTESQGQAPAGIKDKAMMECRERRLGALPLTVCEYNGADRLPAAPGLSCLQDSCMETSSTALDTSSPLNPQKAARSTPLLKRL
ncbi:uncharacterized protein LOC132347911 isoform X1 [Balaenoptera ricei]|uniref:uncharacterized protein LOC132347911 isoform X1 n=1 Tax=Balaenoptera ricei TaxID=2746895 RepID=UPI0028BF14F6|nr:uncharacterized protein LOC132347911 isoform X1 [Balaenoptera ricei]